MKHLFVPYELAVKLKEKGFDEPCVSVFRGKSPYFDTMISGYESDILSQNEFSTNSNFDKIFVTNKTNKDYWITRPFYQQVIDWLRENKIKVVENPKFGGWEIWGKYDDNYIQLSNSGYNIDNAIEEALNQI